MFVLLCGYLVFFMQVRRIDRAHLQTHPGANVIPEFAPWGEPAHYMQQIRAYTRASRASG